MTSVAWRTLRRSCSVAERLPGRVGKVGARCRRRRRESSSRPARPRSRRGSPRGAGSARRAPAAERPPICIRHELSPAAQTVGAGLEHAAAPCRRAIAVETSAFLTANVPPKPQHSSCARQRHEAQAAHRLQQPRSADRARCSDRSEWQDVCSVTVCGNDAPTSVTPSLSTSSSENSKTRARSSSTSRCSAASPPRRPSSDSGRASSRRTTPTARRSARAPEHVDHPPHQRQRVGGVAGVVVHLSAAGLRLAELDRRARAARAR